MRMNYRKLWAPVLVAGSIFTFSCSDDDPEPTREGIAKSSLIFTEITDGESLEAHGDHFHGLADGVEGEKVTVEFDAEGNATSGGHLHLDPHGIYKIELQAWDYQGNRVEGEYVKDKTTADLYKAFLLGGDFVLNPETIDESGAIFQPREQTYGDGTAVNGKYEVTGVLSYFTVGESNEGEKDVTFVVRKFADPATKATIERTDWNANDYAARFPGEDMLTLDFEIHAGHDH